MNWRPDGWRNPNPNFKAPTNDFCYSQHDLYLEFESGADAMLKALFKLADESPTKTFVINARTIQSYFGTEKENGKG